MADEGAPDPKSKRRRYLEEGKRAVRICDEYAVMNQEGIDGTSATEANVETGEYLPQPNDVEKSHWSEEEMEMLDKDGEFDIVPNEKKLQIFNDVRKRLEYDGILRRVCSVCDTIVLRNRSVLLSPKQRRAKKWVRKLQPTEELPLLLRTQYDISESLPLLKGALLSKAGVRNPTEQYPKITICVCMPCLNSLDSKSLKPPKFAIANGFAIGCLPEHLDECNIIERRMTSRTSVACPMTILRGGKHSVIKAHVTVFTFDPGEVAKRLPVVLSRENEQFQLIMAGTMTKMQEIAAMKRHVAKATRIYELLRFYLRHNPLYADVTADWRVLEKQERNGNISGVLLQRRVPATSAEKVNEDESSVRDTDHLGTAATEEEETEYHQNTSMLFDALPNTTIESLKLARDTVLIRNRGRLVTDYDMNLLALAYPDLFPFGYGHPGTNRAVQVSFEECCRYYFRLSNRRFAQNVTFPVVVFNICGRRRVALSTSIRCKMRPDEFRSFAGVTRDELAKELEINRRLRERAMAGRYSELERIKEKSDALPKRVLNGVKTSVNHMWGSTEERLVYRRRAFSLDVNQKGGGVFVTLTPNDAGTMTISYYAGKISTENLLELSGNNVPSHAERLKIAGTDPVACVQYFNEILDAFFEIVVGFDKNKGLPFRRGGLFGICKAYVGAIEAQGSGTLHFHVVIFIAGLPRTNEQFIRSCEHRNEGFGFKQKFAEFVNTVVTCSLPIGFDDSRVPLCPKCNTESLVPVEKFPSFSYKSLRRCIPPPSTSVCSACQSRFGDTEILRSEIAHLHTFSSQDPILPSFQTIPVSDGARESDILTEAYCSIPSKGSWPANENDPNCPLTIAHRLRVCQIGLLVQKHNFRHVPSCFKSSLSSKSGDCRYGFPRHSLLRTKVEESCLKLGRAAHNEYINNYNSVILRLFCSNHDIRFLIGDGTTDALYYALKYATKPQKQVDSLEAILLLSLDRRLETENHLKASGVILASEKLAKARINSMAMASTKKQEISAPMAIQYLVHKTAFVSSHEFSSLLLAQFLSIMNQEEHEITLVQSTSNKFRRATQFDDYVFRHPSIRDINLYEFVSKFERKSSKYRKVVPFDEEAEISTIGNECLLGFKEDHPLLSSHALQKRKRSSVPDIIGPRIPDRTKLADPGENEKYSLILLILFCPFDEENDILRGCSSFSEARLSFENSDEYTYKRNLYVENLQEYYVSKKAASEKREIWAQNRLQEVADDAFQGLEWVNDHSNLEGGAEIDLDGDVKMDSEHDPILSPFEVAVRGVSFSISRATKTMLQSGELRMCMDAKTSWLSPNSSKRTVWPRACITQDGEMYLEIDEDSKELTAEEVMMEISEMKKLAVLGTASHDKPGNIEEMEAGVLTKTPQFVPSQRTFVDLLSSALRDEQLSIDNHEMLWRQHTDADREAIRKINQKTNPTILEVARIFTLNEFQFYAFRMAAVYLLQKLRKSYTKDRNASILGDSSNGDGFQLYIGGEGGTGKSRIVEALLHLCKYWNHPRAIRTCAPTGIAASLVHGQTFHSLVGMAANGGYKAHQRLSNEAIDDFAPVEMLVLDEVSMLGRDELSVLDTHLRRLKECEDSKFGGVGMIFCGDFFQIPPVKKSPVFTSPSVQHAVDGVNCSAAINSRYARDLIGFNLWRAIKNVVVLKETMRYKDDPFYGSIMGRLRMGTSSEQDWQVLNRRVLTGDSLQQLRSSSQGKVPLVVKGNELRHALNWQSVGSVSRSTGITPVVCVANMQPIRGTPFTATEIKALLRTGDQKSYNLAALLPILPGMPIRITQNIAVKIGIANGTEGTLVGVKFPEGTTFKYSECFGVRALLSSNLPNVAFVDTPHLCSRLPNRFQCVPPQFPDSTIPLYPVESAPFSSPKNLENRAMMKMTQLPFVPAFASTSYKVQGMTTDGIVAFPFLKGSPGRPSAAALYVVLSRVRRLRDVFLVRSITREEMQYFVPGRELLDEQRRLLELHEKTIAFQSHI